MEAPTTTAEAARVLGVSPQAIGQMVKRGELEPAYKLPGLRGAFLFHAAAIAALQESRSAA